MQGPSRILSILVLLSSFLTVCAWPPRVKCDRRTKPPTIPSFQDCESFLNELAIKSHLEPKGAYKYYGRDLDPCKECVRLPTIIHFGRRKCAALIDVDDDDEKSWSIFGLADLWQALSDMVAVCWLEKKHNGRGYPASQAAWAGFVRGVSPRTGFLENGTEASWMGLTEGWGNRTVNVIDLTDGWPESGSGGGNVESHSVETA